MRRIARYILWFVAPRWAKALLNGKREAGSTPGPDDPVQSAEEVIAVLRTDDPGRRTKVIK